MQSGHHFRGRIKPVEDGQYKLVQIKDLGADGHAYFERLVTINQPGLKTEQILRKGDVLLVGRGERRQAVAINTDLERATVGSQFFIIRAVPSVDAEYLAWFINQDSAQRYLEEKSVGTNVKVVSREAIAQLPIVLPDLETQTKLAKLHSLNVQQRQLMETIAEKRYRVTEQSLLNLMQASEKGQESK